MTSIGVMPPVRWQLTLLPKTDSNIHY